MAKNQTIQLLEGISANLTEKRNPENDEANDLIRKSLRDKDFAKTHAQELKKHGIEYVPGEGYRGDKLKGKNGRYMDIYKPTFSDDPMQSRAYVGSSDPKWNKEKQDYDMPNDNTYYDANAMQHNLAQKTYSNTKAFNKEAKANIEKQTKKVERKEAKAKEKGERLRWDDRDKEKLRKYQYSVEKGVEPEVISHKIDKDVDLKNFLNAEKPSVKQANAEAPKTDNIVTKYKNIKNAKKYIDSTKEENRKRDQEDQERIEFYKQQAAKEKASRDADVQRREDKISGEDKAIQDRLTAYRDRMAKKNESCENKKLNEETTLKPWSDALIAHCENYGVDIVWEETLRTLVEFLPDDTIKEFCKIEYQATEPGDIDYEE